MFTTVFKRLLLLSAFCCALEAYRLHITDNAGFIFLPFNLILAWIPIGLAVLAGKQNKWWAFAPCFIAWLAFFPNSPYIITDLIHLKPRAAMPFWFDTVLMYSFAFTGLVLGMLSAVIVYNKLKELTGRYTAQGIMMVVMLLSGYGIYMGRVLRWNSWNILTHPTGIYYDTVARITDPFNYPRTYGMTLIFAALLWLVFSVFESLMSTHQQISESPKTTSL
ncbi:MAG TPA: DUF1361 domain-containing protein [Chitinophagales bacterium]|nr:DUF1361 domain-containing protein [Chitinophagales bacterium]